jgi:hypothetical protein
MHSSIPVIIDGPNYINRLLDLGIGPSHLSRQLILRGLMEVIDQELHTIPGITGKCSTTEFFCSKRRFGSGASKFTQEQQSRLLARMCSEVGVYVDVIDIPGSSEKGVDTTISGKLEDLATEDRTVILVSADRDYIPTLKKLRHKLEVILFSPLEELPVELQNEAYATIFLGYGDPFLFSYAYPRFDIATLTIEQCADLVSEADDRCSNQLRVDHDGKVYIAKRDENFHFLDHVRFSFESYATYNGYVGPKRASKVDKIQQLYNDIKSSWKDGREGYIDY